MQFSPFEIDELYEPFFKNSLMCLHATHHGILDVHPDFPVRILARRKSFLPSRIRPMGSV